MEKFLNLQKACEKDKKDIIDIKRKIAKIEEKKGDVDQEVFNKIHSEYQIKLKNAIKKNERDSIELEKLTEGFGKKLTQNEDEVKKLKKEIDEIELRYLAEEFDENEYKKRIGAKKEHYDSLMVEIKQLKSVLEGESLTPQSIDEETTTAKIEEKEIAEKVPEQVKKETAPEKTGGEITEEKAGKAEESMIENLQANLDETLEDIFGTNLEETTEEKPIAREKPSEEAAKKTPEPNKPAEEEKNNEGESFDNFFNENEVGELIDELKGVTEENPVKENEKKPKKSEEQLVKKEGKENEDNTFIEHDTVITVNPDEDPEDKYIVCPKCGHKNKPDSWFCEKCGADLMQ